jgi:hypothetical protein
MGAMILVFENHPNMPVWSFPLECPEHQIGYLPLLPVNAPANPSSLTHGHSPAGGSSHRHSGPFGGPEHESATIHPLGKILGRAAPGISWSYMDYEVEFSDE